MLWNRHNSVVDLQIVSFNYIYNHSLQSEIPSDTECSDKKNSSSPINYPFRTFTNLSLHEIVPALRAKFRDPHNHNKSSASRRSKPSKLHFPITFPTVFIPYSQKYCLYSLEIHTGIFLRPLISHQYRNFVLTISSIDLLTLMINTYQL